MIELKSITVEKMENRKPSNRQFLRGGEPVFSLEDDNYYMCNNINIELRAPLNLDINKFHRQFQQLLDMENRKSVPFTNVKPSNPKFLRGGEFECSLTMPRANRYNILKIYHNKEKRTTVVCFDHSIMELFGINTEESEAKIKVKRDSEDLDDIYLAVASAVMIRKYESNSQFKAHIRRSMPKGFDGHPDVYQMIAAAEVSNIYGSWEKFCKIVDEKLEVNHGKREETNAR